MNAVTTNERDVLPNRRRCVTQKVSVGGHTVFYSWSLRTDGRVGELFIDVAKAGSSLRFWSTGFARMLSTALQYGTPLETIVSMFVGTRAEPYGPVQGHPRITSCASIVDLVVRSLAIDHLGREDLADIRPAIAGIEYGTGTGDDAC